MNKHLLLLSFLAFTCHAEEITKKSYTQEQLITVRQNALNHAMEVLKDKKPSPDEILKVAKEFEAYMLADDVKKVKEQFKQEVSPNDFEKSQQPKVNIVSNEEKTSFSGLSLGINGQFKSTTAKVKAGDYGIDGLGQQNFITNLQADYEFRIDNKWGVLLGATIDFNDNDLLNARGGIHTNKNHTIRATEKNHYSLFVAPTYRLSSDTSGYLKLAYHNSKIEHSNDFNYSQGTKSLHGYGVGVGVRSYLTKNIFANLEIQRIMYSDDSFFLSNLGTGSTVGSFGLGYSFADDRKQPLVAESSKGKFNGLSLGIAGLLKSSSIKTSTTINGIANNLDSVGQQNLGIGMFGDYAFRVSDRALFLLGGTYDFNDSDIVKVYGRSGTHFAEILPFSAFEYIWKTDGYWSMVALPLDQIPASATETRYANAILAIEKSGHTKNAHIAYNTLLKRWPKSLVGLMGIGNTAVKLKDLEGAKSAFLIATQEHPQAVEAFNNLAYVFSELGEAEKAIIAAENAVALGGPLLEKSKETLLEIRQKIK